MNNHHVATPKCPGADDDRIEHTSPDRLLNPAILDMDVYNRFSRPWLQRACRAAHRSDWMAALIYLWVTFNAWLSLVVADRRYSDSDSYLWKAAGLDPALAMRFQQLLETDESFQSSSYEFRELWPVFKVRALVEHGIESWGAWGQQESRADYRRKCFSCGLSRNDYSPRCYVEHQPKDIQVTGGSPLNVPLDWAHTLSAIYQVRCSLFHGGKSFLSSRDLDFTRLAYSILDNVWRYDTSVAQQIIVVEC